MGAPNPHPTLFYLHGDINGGGFYCLALAAHLGADQPMYALAPHGANGERVPDTVEAMATHRLQLVRTLQPEGPYQLGGHCNGALVAFEMACQLVAAGERVHNVLLISPPIYPGPLVETRLHAAAWIEQFQHGAGAARLQMLRRLVFFPFTAPARRAPMQIAAPSSGSLPRDPSGALTAYRSVLRRYRPRRYDGAVTVFWPQTQVTEFGRDPRRVWPSIAPRVEVVPVPGAHLTCITVNARELGHAMRARLSGL
jgi:thioesterase domain-containing protein